MASKMLVFLEGSATAQCVSSHYYFEPHLCELCLSHHSQESVVVKNRAGKKLHADVNCIREMVRFQVVDVIDLGKWLGKLPAIKAVELKRKQDDELRRQEERARLEKKVIIRKREKT